MATLGDVVLVRGRSVLDRMIQWATGSPFSHAALVGDGHLIEAAWPTVRRAQIDLYRTDGWHYRVIATEQQRRAAVSAAEARVGQPYGVRELLIDDTARYLAHIILRIRPRYLTCSHLVVAAYLAAGVRLTWAPYPSPADLAYSPLLCGERPGQPRRVA